MSDESVTDRSVGKQVSMRERFILAGLFFFSYHGYAKTSIQKLTAHCSVNRTLFYEYFDDKEALAMACIQYQQTYYEEHVFALLLPKPTRATIRWMLRVFKQFILNLPCSLSDPLPLLPHHLVIVFMLDCPRPMKTRIDAFLRSWQEFFYRLLSGFYDENRARVLAHSQMRQWMGACIYTSLYSTSQYLLDCWSELNALLKVKI